MMVAMYQQHQHQQPLLYMNGNIAPPQSINSLLINFFNVHNNPLKLNGEKRISSSRPQQHQIFRFQIIIYQLIDILVRKLLVAVVFN